MPAGGGSLPTASPDYTLRRDIAEVHLQFTVTDSHGAAVRNLSAEDIRVFDGEAQVLRFNQFERDEDLPLEIGVLLDTSDSVRRILPEQKAAAARFLMRVMRPGTDSAFVIGFSGDMRVWRAPTGNLTEMASALESMRGPGWGTRLYDAVYAACGHQFQVKPGASTRRAIVLLSDGDDTDSLRSLSDAIGIALRNEVQIYALAIRPGNKPYRGDPIMQRIAEATGARMYVARSSRELDTAFAQIEQDLRTQYRLSFSPQQPTAGYHAIRLELRDPANAEVHARQGYFVAGH
jgi:VWFA-related protein